MLLNSWLQLVLYFAILLALVKPLGWYMAKVYQGEAFFAKGLFGWLESGIYRLAGLHPEEEMNWKQYTVGLLAFNLLGFMALYAMQRLQSLLPLNPQTVGAVSPDSSFNTAISFATNTNWQGYAGESTMSYFTQMVGLTVQNFLSAGTGMAVLVALARALARTSAQTIGNFWVDLTRSVIYILLPLSLILAIALVSQGVVQSFQPAQVATLLQSTHDANGAPVTQQIIPLGAAASQIAIKQLGTNGGGFFNANSAHPFENPTPLSNFLEMLAILLIPAAFCYTFGSMVRQPRQGWALLAAMTIVLFGFMLSTLFAEQQGNPLFQRLGVDDVASAMQPGGNMEGKELRFGIVNSAIWATATTAASNGSVNAMHDSFTPIGGMAPMILMQLGEVIFGGVGSGLYGMLTFVIVAIFVAGLMVGRTPEYLGKKIEAFEIKMASLVILIPCATVLIVTALAVIEPMGRASILNTIPGAHGFSEILYAASSAGNNNGSAFAGLNANTPFYNTLLGVAMLVARYWLIVPTLAMAEALAGKKHTPASVGTLPTDSPLFVGLLIGIIVIIGALTFIPALALGPIIEQLMMHSS